MRDESDWIASWIEQQRQQLQQGSPAGTPEFPFQEQLREIGLCGLDIVDLWRKQWPGFAPSEHLGPAREQMQAWRELAAAQGEYQKVEQELRAVLMQVQLDALTRLEQRIRTAQLTQPIANFQELHALWVQCGEEVFAAVAHSDTYCRLQAELGNATMRLRACQQVLIEQALKKYDLPTRAELNTVHRQMRELRERLAALEAQMPKEEHE